MFAAGHSRTRFILTLLPPLQRTSPLRCVVAVFASGKDGRMYVDEVRDHITSMGTLVLQAATHILAL
jgi:hypothetical protein